MVAGPGEEDRAAKEAPADPWTPMAAVAVGRRTDSWVLTAGAWMGRPAHLWILIVATGEIGHQTNPPSSTAALPM